MQQQRNNRFVRQDTGVVPSGGLRSGNPLMPSGVVRDGHTAIERLKALLVVTSLPSLLTEEEAEAMLSIGAENVVPNIPATLAKFVQTYCSPPPFTTTAARTEWMNANAWCPAVNVPPVVCAQPPASFESEAARVAWMHEHPECPPPPAFCPPPPSFRSAEEKAQWATAHPTCPVPEVDDHVCPANEPHCHDVTAPAPAPVPATESGFGFWKGAAVAATVIGAGWWAAKHRSEEDRANPTAKQIVPIVFGGAAVVGAVMLLKPSSASAMTSIESSRPVSLPAPAPHAPATPAPPTADARIGRGEQFTTNAPGTPAAIVSRLNSGPMLVRQLFAFQALLYSYGFTPYYPDGLMGDHTRAMIEDINTIAGADHPTSTFSPSLYALANDKLSRSYTLNKLIPSLPANTIHLVNQAIVAMAPGAPLLQVQAA